MTPISSASKSATELSVELVLGFLRTVGTLITLWSKAVEAYRAPRRSKCKLSHILCNDLQERGIVAVGIPHNLITPCRGGLRGDLPSHPPAGEGNRDPEGEQGRRLWPHLIRDSLNILFRRYYETPVSGDFAP